SVRHDVDLLPSVLADVADPEVTRLPVEGEAPGVAQPDPDGLPRDLRAGHIEPEELAELRRRVLRVVLRIATRSAVPVARIELAVGAELQLAAVVVRVRLLDEEQRLGGLREDLRSVRLVAD